LIDNVLDFVLLFLASILQVLVINHNALVDDHAATVIIRGRDVLLLGIVLRTTSPFMDIARWLGLHFQLLLVGLLILVALP
jgi:hypothetical protein